MVRLENYRQTQVKKAVLAWNNTVSSILSILIHCQINHHSSAAWEREFVAAD